MRALLAAVVVLAVLSHNACDGDVSAPPGEGTVTLGNDDGVDFATGRVQRPGNFANSDIFTTHNGESGMKLATGGASPVENRPITWFRNGGGIPEEFPDLASVPTSPAPTAPDAMLHVKLGNGFLVEAKNGDLVHGWVARSSESEVEIRWERVPVP